MGVTVARRCLSLSKETSLLPASADRIWYCCVVWIVLQSSRDYS
jgi:hypothetical protein